MGERRTSWPSNSPVNIQSTRALGEIERLRIQSDAIAAETERLLDLIAIQAGWRCTSP